MRQHPLSLLFVCTANISRSPYAERRARAWLGDAPVQVASAGVPGLPCRPMDPQMAAVLQQRGIDPEGHLSRCLNDDILEGVDVVLTFEYAHRLRILEGWPHVIERTFGVQQFARAAGKFDAAPLTGPELVARAATVAERDSMGLDVDDPYGRGKRVARSAAAEIDTAVRAIVTWVTGEAVPPEGEGEETARLWRWLRPARPRP